MYEYLTTPTAKKPQSELDPAPFRSEGHPAPEDIPAPPENLRRAWAGCSGARQRREGDLVYSALDIYDVYKAHKSELQAEEDWWSRAEALDRAGDRRLLQFLLARHDLPQLLSKVSKVGLSAEVARRSRLTRPQLFIEALAAFRCTCPWPGRWRSAAEEVVRFNGYAGQEVEAAVLHALAYGRAKQRNVFIVGDTNRAKSFCLKPLAMIYHAFTAPDSGTHQVFVGRGPPRIGLKAAGLFFLSGSRGQGSFVSRSSHFSPAPRDGPGPS